MNTRTLFGALAVLILCGGCQNDETDQQFRGFSDYLESLGYSFYNPPRTDRGAGSVFRFVELQSGARGVSPVCRNIFPGLKIIPSSLSIPNEKRSNVVDFDFALNFISDLVHVSPEFTAEFDRSQQIELQILGDVKSFSFTEEDSVLATGAPRELSPACYARLRELSERGELAGNVFFIQEAVQVSSVAYSFAENTKGGAAATVPLSKLFVPKAGVQTISESSETLAIVEPRFVAFKAMLINEFVDTGLTAAGSARISATPIQIETMP